GPAARRACSPTSSRSSRFSVATARTRACATRRAAQPSSGPGTNGSWRRYGAGTRRGGARRVDPESMSPSRESDISCGRGGLAQRGPVIDARGIGPFVPSGGDFHRSRDLFRALGFEETWSADEYVGFRSGAAKFILQKFDNAEFASNLMIRIDVRDLDAWWAEISTRQLETHFPGFRIKAPTAFPWARESHVIGLAGVCWHVGQP